MCDHRGLIIVFSTALFGVLRVQLMYLNVDIIVYFSRNYTDHVLDGSRRYLNSTI